MLFNKMERLRDAGGEGKSAISLVSHGQVSHIISRFQHQ
jgi:hypothetical protein